MKFKNEVLYNLACGDKVEGFERLENELVDHSRWSVIYSMVFTTEGKFFRSNYSRGATEYQEESPYEYDGDEIECEEVFPKEFTITRYVTKEEL